LDPGAGLARPDSAVAEGKHSGRRGTPCEPGGHSPQNRANQYADEVRRFQATRVKRDKAGEAPERKQIKFLTAMGMKAADLQADLSKSAKAFEAHLAEIRPPLISRPGSPSTDGKNVR
jgi:hypothetical protein